MGPVGKITLVFNINPLLVVFVAGFVLNEIIAIKDILLTLVSFIGVWCLCSFQNSIGQEKYQHQTFGIILAFISAVFTSCSTLVVKKMNQKLHYLYAVFYAGFSGFIIVYPVILLFPSLIHFSQYSKSDCLILTLASITDTLGQIFFSLALKYEDAAKISPLLYLTIVFGFVSDILLFNYRFSFMEMVGTLLVFIPIVF